MALGYANRAAVLVRLRRFREAFDDCQLALEGDYPHEKRTKVYFRQAECVVSMDEPSKLGPIIEGIEKNSDSRLLSKQEQGKLEMFKAKYAAAGKCALPITQTEPQAESRYEAALEVVVTPEQGRHVIAKEPIQENGIIASETAVSFVPVYDPECSSILPSYDCQKCGRVNVIPVVCSACGQACYCSIQCRENQQSVHRFECHGYKLGLWRTIGIAHLGIRCLLDGFGTIRDEILKANSATVCYKRLIEVANDEENAFGHYGRVFRLVTNFEKMHRDDVVRYALVSVMLAIYLTNFTEFASEHGLLQHDGPKQFVCLGAIIMRHIGQLVCNGHAISELRATPTSDLLHHMREDSFLPTAGLLHLYLRSARVFTAIFPQISMFNHDCDPNIRNHFERSTLKVYATRPIAAGSEIVNCYGPNYKLMPGETRSMLLRHQYCFDCTCDRCRTGDDTFYNQFNTVQCPRCGDCFTLELHLQDIKVGKSIVCPQCSERIGKELHELLLNLECSEQNQQTELCNMISAIYHRCTTLLVDFNQTKADILQDILHQYTQRAIHSSNLRTILRKLALKLATIRRHQYGVMSLEFLTGCFYLLDNWAALHLHNGATPVQLNAEERTVLKEFRVSLAMVGEDTRTLISEYMLKSAFNDRYPNGRNVKMAQPAPLGLDVTELKFKLQSKVPIFKGDGNAKNGCNLLATASVHGLVFVGTVGSELRVLKLKDITTDRVINEIVPLRTVPLPSEPYQLAVSCDHGLLAVDIIANGVPFVYIYSVPSFLTGSILRVHEIKTSAQPTVRSTQLCWNPVMHNVLAVRTEAGGLSVYTLKEPAGLEFHSLDTNNPAERAQCACWSPKGKQLVVAFANGKLVQYKPDLKPARTIVCPAGVVEGGGAFDVLAVQWLSTYQFAAVFLPHADDSVPALFIVNAPKAGNPVFINYDDICYSQSGPRKGQVFLQHILPWNLVLMASANSMEVGILGTTESGEAPTWCQWTTTDEARAELPLTSDKQETFPIGLVLETGCTHELVIGEQTFPVMPMIHLLSTYGQLVSFNVLNTLPNVPNICSPPKPVQDLSGGAFVKLDVEKSAPGVATTQQQPSGNVNPLPHTEISFAVPSGATSTPAITKSKSFFSPGVGEAVQKSPINLFGGVGATGQQQQQKPATIAPTFGKQITFGSTPAGGTGGANEKKTTTFGGFSAPGTTTSTFGLGTTASGLPTMSAPPFQAAMASMGGSTPVSAPSTTVPSDVSKPLVTVPPTYVPTVQQQSNSANTNTGPSRSQATPKKSDFSTEDSNAIIRTLTIDELNRFTRELTELQQRNRSLNVQIGHKEESAQIIRNLRELEDIIAQANESTQSLVSDVQTLRLGLNEAFAMVAEANSKSAIYNNPTVHQYQEAHGMSQTSRRQLGALENMLQVNENQLQTVTKQLKAQLMCLEEAKQSRAKQRMHIPSLEVLYQTLSKQQDILNRQGEKLAYLKNKLGLRGSLKGLEDRNSKQLASDMTDTSESAIESLTDSILSMTLGDQVAADTRKLSESKLSALRRSLVGRKVVTVKPQRPDRVGLSSEVVRERRDQVRRFNVEQEKAKVTQPAGGLKATSNNVPLSKEPEQSKQPPQQQQRVAPQQQQQQQPSKPSVKPLGTATANKAFSFGSQVPSAAPSVGSFSFGQTTITPMPAVESAMKPTPNGGSISTGLSFGVSTSKEADKEKKENIPVSLGGGKENIPINPVPSSTTTSKPSSTPFSFASAGTFASSLTEPSTSGTSTKSVFSFGGTAGVSNGNQPTGLSFGSLAKPNFSFDLPTVTSAGGNGTGISFTIGGPAEGALSLGKPKGTVANENVPPVEEIQKDKPLPPSFGPTEPAPSAKAPLPALTSLLQKVDSSSVDLTVKSTPASQVKPGGGGTFGSITGGTSFGSGGLFASVAKPAATVAISTSTTGTNEAAPKPTIGGGLLSGISFGSLTVTPTFSASGAGSGDGNTAPTGGSQQLHVVWFWSSEDDRHVLNDNRINFCGGDCINH
uniref:Nuclear pore complex protein Nup214 n=1 Tax=Anopheles minimus TaxID=112268 RepID=A0A182WGB6_9DIPT